MNENKETEKMASIKSEATITQEDIINKIAEETDVSKDDIENILNVMAKVIEKEEVTTKTITNISTLYLPSKGIKEVLKDVRFVKSDSSDEEG